MKSGILLVAFMLGVASSGAQTVQDEVAIREKKRAIEVARVTSTINQSYLREYETLLQRANLTGDAQGANLVRAMIRRLNPAPETTPVPDKKPEIDPTTVLTTGTWMDMAVRLNGGHKYFTREFRPGGELVDEKGQPTGTWKIVENELRLEFSDVSVKFPLPLRTDKWEGAGSNNVAHFMSANKARGTVPTPSPAGTPAGKPDYFGKPES